jgi:hypothetical protein
VDFSTSHLIGPVKIPDIALNFHQLEPIALPRSRRPAKASVAIYQMDRELMTPYASAQGRKELDSLNLESRQKLIHQKSAANKYSLQEGILRKIPNSLRETPQHKPPAILLVNSELYFT